jgi:hypothetical protein
MRRLGHLLWPLVCCLLLILLLDSARPAAPAAATATVVCPAGQDALPWVNLADVTLRQGASPYSRMTLARVTVAPGEALDVIPSGYTAYFVESGVLEYQSQPWLSITQGLACAPRDGHYAATGGSFSIDDDNVLSVGPGQALILEDVPASAIANGGSEPLVVLQMTLIPPEIDPVSGLPVVDPIMVGREAFWAREEQKQACRDAARAETLGTPVDWEGLAVSPATPAVSTAGWETDGDEREPRVPKACRGKQG